MKMHYKQLSTLCQGIAANILLLLLLCGAAPSVTLAQVEEHEDGADSESLRDDSHTHTLEHAGLSRTYRLFVPDSYKSHKRVPLLVLLHGGGSDGRRMVKFTGFNRIAEDEGMIIATPNGIDRHWNDGRANTGYRAHEQGVDDVGFISQLIDKLAQEYRIDRDRVYVAGISNGGMMSYRLGLEIPGKIAAIAPVVAALPEELAKKQWSGRPVPAVIINGTEDPLIKWDGGEIKIFFKSAGRVLPVPQTVKFWVEHNRCSSPPTECVLPDSDPADGMRVVKSVYVAGKGGADVTFYAVEGGGHTWHGPRPFVQYLPPSRIGRACKDFDCTEAIWEFFSKHPMATSGATESSNQGKITE